MKVKEVRKTLIEVIKHLDTYSDRELVEIKGIADKLKEMAMYEEFCRGKDVTDEMHQISEEDFQFLKDGCHHIMSIAMTYANPFASDMEDWGSVHGDADLMLRVLEEVENDTN